MCYLQLSLSSLNISGPPSAHTARGRRPDSPTAAWGQVRGRGGVGWYAPRGRKANLLSDQKRATTPCLSPSKSLSSSLKAKNGLGFQVRGGILVAGKALFSCRRRGKGKVSLFTAKAGNFFYSCLQPFNRNLFEAFHVPTW